MPVHARKRLCRCHDSPPPHQVFPAAAPAVRRLTTADAPVVLAAHAAGWAGAGWAPAALEAVVAGRQPGTLALGAFRAGRLAGVAVVSRVADEGAVEWVGTAPECRRQVRPGAGRCGLFHPSWNGGRGVSKAPRCFLQLLIFRSKWFLSLSNVFYLRGAVLEGPTPPHLLGGRVDHLLPHAFLHSKGNKLSSFQAFISDLSFAFRKFPSLTSFNPRRSNQNFLTSGFFFVSQAEKR